MIKLSDGRNLPLDMHKVKIIQRLPFPTVEQRLAAIREAGFNTFLLRTRDMFLDMLTDSGTNAQSDAQLAASMEADDAYAGSESFYKLAEAVREVFGCEYTLPVHQGRAAEHLIAKCFVKPGHVIPMNQHFTTTKAHFVMAGGTVEEICIDEAFNTDSSYSFKGNLDIEKLKSLIFKHGADKIPFIRMESTANLLGGQPFSMANLKEVRAIADQYKIPIIVDTSLIGDNAYMIKRREAGYENRTIGEIIHEIISMADLIYMSARKSCTSRGGLIATRKKEIYDLIAPLVPVYEGFLTYGGISTREIESMAVGLREMTDEYTAGCAADLIEYFVARLSEKGVPVVTPAGGVGAHIDAMRFLPHLDHPQYPAGALAAAIFICSGVRGMERGTVSMDRDIDGTELISELELVRLAVPRRVFTLSHIEYVVDRVAWLYNHREMIGGLTFEYEPEMLRFFLGRLKPVAAGKAASNWDEKLAQAFIRDFSLDM
ncbi:tryptophanase [Zhaonella formicivorans]|jgi:tryptophanase|uniref:tryptophanase n=1 Tax=Zhaonella formicivorans TaxID=2528593 RepID=UPI0010E3C782|nr:tryptophanase [Zhaonella formicivorans]